MVENHVPEPQIQYVLVNAYKQQITHRSGHVWLQDRLADSSAESFWRRLSQESCVTPNIIFGLNNDVEIVSILFLVSMSGMGRMKKVKKDWFELMVWVWVCVYGDFDVFNVSKVLFQGNQDFANVNLFQVAFKEELSLLRCLLVLDDVWNENLFLLLYYKSIGK